MDNKILSEALTFDDVILPKGKLSYQLWIEQKEIFKL